MSHIVVVGAGQAGQALVCKLRELKFDGQITLIGEEPVPPYQRPPLSKDYLLGKTEVERLYLRPLEYYGEHDITLRTGQKVTGVDPVNKTVQVAGEEISYDHLALTTGAIPHRLPAAIGGDLKGLHVVRTLADVDQMEPEFQAGRNVLIVGGGYIGLEAAAVAARKGLNVTLVEMADRILQRVAARETSDFVRATHEKEGVTIREGVGLKQLNGDGTVQSATLSDGSELPVDFVIVGVGVAPATEVAQMAGLTLDNGICTNELGQTSDPSIWSAGDCASFPYKGTRIRLESVGNANDQAELVAENMLGAGKAYEALPWFWSDQYEMRLQIAGLNTGYDNVVTRPGKDETSMSFWYYQGDTLLAVDAVTDPRSYMVAKRLIAMGKSPSRADIADPETNLKSLLKA